MLFYGTKLLDKSRKIRIDLTVLKVLSLGGWGWRNESVPLITMAWRDWITLVSLRWISVRRRLCSTTLIIRILSWIHTYKLKWILTTCISFFFTYQVINTVFCICVTAYININITQKGWHGYCRADMDPHHTPFGIPVVFPL